jgi:aspartokinase
MTSIKYAVTQVVENSDFAKKGLLLGLLNISAYAKTIRKDVEEITRSEVKNDYSIVMALSRYGRELRQRGEDVTPLRVKSISSRSQLTGVIYDKTPEVQERLAMMLLLDAVKRAQFFVTLVGQTQIVVVSDSSMQDMITGHFGTVHPGEAHESLACLVLEFDGAADRYHAGQSYRALERLASQGIRIIDYMMSSSTLTVFVDENDAGTAYQLLYKAFQGKKS